MLKRVMSRFLVGFFCFAVPKSSVGKPFVLCLRKLLLVKRLRIREGEYQDIPLTYFCPTVSKTFLEEPFCVSENFGYRINFD